jgi:hypothetical protein
VFNGLPFSVVLAKFAGVLLRACLDEEFFFGVFADGPAAGRACSSPSFRGARQWALCGQVPQVVAAQW